MRDLLELIQPGWRAIDAADPDAVDAYLRIVVETCIAEDRDVPQEVRDYARRRLDPEQARRRDEEAFHRALLRLLGPEGEIDEAYARLAELETHLPSPETEEEIRRTIARLRELQHAEAERMRGYFERHRALDIDAARRAMDDARALIRRHARPS